jgi:hypothetical protein
MALVAAVGRPEVAADATPLWWLVPQPTASISTIGTALTVGNHFLIGGLLLCGNRLVGNRFAQVQQTRAAVTLR